MISVIIPTYNRAATITGSVQSILRQTYQDLELIVVDDGSTDGTAGLLENLPLRYIYQANAGAAKARNTGIEAASGDYISFHDSDDLAYPDKLRRELDFMAKTGADIVSCNLRMQNYQMPHNLPTGIITNQSLYGIGTQSLLLKASVAKSNPFPLGLPAYEDFAYLYGLSKNYKLAHLNEVLVEYSYTENSLSRSDAKKRLAIEKILAMYPELADESATYQIFMLIKAIAEYKEELDYQTTLTTLYHEYPNPKTACYHYLAKAGLFPLVVYLKEHLPGGLRNFFK